VRSYRCYFELASHGGISALPRVLSYSPSTGQVGDFVTITGLRFTGATAVEFNGTAAIFTVLGAENILATVPGGATTGGVEVTTAAGADTGPTFTVTANAFAFNLDALTLPSGLTGARTGDPMYLARTAGTTAVEESGAAIYEQREDGRGQWTFPAYENSVPDPEDFSGWTMNGAPVLTTGQSDPVGTTLATKINDTSAVAVATLFSPAGGTPAYDGCASIWVKDDAVAPPTATGAIGASDGGGGFPQIYCGTLTRSALGTGTTWRRVHAKIGTGGVAAAPRCIFAPSGQTPVYNAYCTQDAAGTGARHFWGAQAMGGPAADYGSFDAPTLFGTTGERVIEVDAAKLPDVLDGNGDLDIEGRLYFPDLAGAVPNGETRIVSIDAPGGISRLAIDTVAFEAELNSGAPIGQSIGFGRPGQLIEWRLWHKPTENSFGFAVRFNGAIATVDAHVTPLGSVDEPTAMFLGCNEDGATMILPAMHTLLRRSARAIATVYDAEGVCLGDSTFAPYSGIYVLVSSLIYEDDEAAQRLGILSLAATAQSAVQQLAAWQASSAQGNPDVAWVSVQVGINDIAAAANTATVIARIQAIVDDVNLENPSAYVLLVPMTPFGFTAGDLTTWNAVNQAIIGNGGTPVTGSNLIRLGLWTELEDGSTGALKAEYDSGDGQHENDLAREYMATQYRAALVANNLL
jgi:hypothetical protein